jgi:hypothetical protein
MSGQADNLQEAKDFYVAVAFLFGSVCHNNKSFLVLFFKKELLPYFSSNADFRFRFRHTFNRLTPQRLAWEKRMSLAARDAADEDTRDGSFRVDESVLDELGLPQPVGLAVPANTLVVADTFGFHARRRSAAPSLRVEIWGFRPAQSVPSLDQPGPVAEHGRAPER